MKEIMGFEEAWAKYDTGFHKTEVLLDELIILSYLELDNGVIKCRIIDPQHMNLVLSGKSKIMTLTNLPSWAIVMIKKTGLAFKYHNNLMLADKLLLKCFDDYFGISKSAAQSSFWRDIHLAHLFKERGFANMSVQKRDGYKIIVALHKTKLNGIDTDVRELVNYYHEEKGAEIYHYDYDTIHFEVELLFPEITKNGWCMSLTIRDSNIGRESMTFYTGWRKNNGVIYMEELKKGHRSSKKLTEILFDVEELMKETEKIICFPVSLDINMIKNGLKDILGKGRTKKLDTYLVERKEQEDILYEAASYHDDDIYDAQMIRIRTKLGAMVKEVAHVKDF